MKSCFLASKKMFQACGFHYSVLFSLSISKIDDNFNLDIKILNLKIKPVGPSQYPHTHTSRPCQLMAHIFQMATCTTLVLDDGGLIIFLIADCIVSLVSKLPFMNLTESDRSKFLVLSE